MYRVLLFTLLVVNSTISLADEKNEQEKIERAVLDYIVSQHNVKPELMKRGIDKELAKRTYWRNKQGKEFVLKTDFDTMVWVAQNYNKEGNKFPESPRIDIDILDVDNRVASVKLTADDWIDYMHLYKDEHQSWKIINVLWQYHDEKRHVSKQ